MKARREATQQTREAILRAAYELWIALPYDEVTLDEIAETAGVSRQTVHRHFGSKEELMIAVTEWRRPQEAEAMSAIAPGDVGAGIAWFVDRYEEMGDAVVRFLAIEGRIGAVDDLLSNGREAHLAEIEHIFGSLLSGDRSRTVLALYAATDVMVWKLLRRDFGRSRVETESVMRLLVEGIVGPVARKGVS